MPVTPRAVAPFYATPRGAVVGTLLRDRLAHLWPRCAGEAILGLGHAAPYLRLWRQQARRCVGVAPAQLEAQRWPADAPNLICASEEDALPFPDLCFDRVLLVHGLELAENARRLLREVWRVLREDGRLLVVVPNRHGVWAHVESTPFGQGQPYSVVQVARLLEAAMFRVERRDTALCIPPTNWRLLLRSAGPWERAGHMLLPGFSGVIISEAVKDVYAAIPLGAEARRRVVIADAA
jgi:SAM-dependent methyltransferase